MMSNTQIVMWAVLSVLLSGCGGQHRETSESLGSPVSIRAQTVRLDQVPVAVTAVGTTEPYARATPGTRLLGRVAHLAVEEGDRVSRGDVLVRIENQDLTARRRQAESALQDVRALLSNAEVNVKRTRNLYADKAVTKQKLDQSETEFARAQAGLNAAEGALQEVEANLSYGLVKSPLNGVVVRKFVQSGDMATPGAPLFTVEQQDPMKVTVEVSEQDLIYIQVDKPVLVEIDALRAKGPSGPIGTPPGGKSATPAARMGDVEAVIPSADPGTRTFQARVVLPNPDMEIRSGMFATVRFPMGERSGILVPMGAVVQRGQLQGVFVISEGRARLRWVRLGKSFGERIEVISGLGPGEQVAVSGLDRLIDGVQVEVSSDG